MRNIHTHLALHLLLLSPLVAFSSRSDDMRMQQMGKRGEVRLCIHHPHSIVIHASLSPEQIPQQLPILFVHVERSCSTVLSSLSTTTHPPPSQFPIIRLCILCSFLSQPLLR